MSNYEFQPFPGRGSGGFVQGDYDLSELDDELVQTAFKREGCLVFRSKDCDPSKFVNFSNRFSRGFIHNPGPLRTNLGQAGTLQSVNRSMTALPLHSEMTYLPHPIKPEILWLYCQMPAKSGGETMVCDGHLLASYIQNGPFAKLATRNLRYRKVYGPETWSKFSGCSDGQKVITALKELGIGEAFKFRKQALCMNHVLPLLSPGLFSEGRNFVGQIIHDMIRGRKKPIFEDGSVVDQHFFKALKTQSDQIKVQHEWQIGDILMLDNTRFLHGRNPQDGQRTIHSRIAYANFGTHGNCPTLTELTGVERLVVG